MSFDDLSYGWHDVVFELTEIGITRRIQLQQIEDGEWQQRFASYRSAFVKGEADAVKIADDHETFDDVRYSRPLGVVRGKARLSDDLMNCMYLGIPENKQQAPLGDRESIVEAISVAIHASDWATEADLVREGAIRYIKGSEHHDEDVVARFIVSAPVFDEIEKAIKQSTIGVQLTMSIRGWYWLGPIGDSYVYFDKTEGQRAELIEISATQAVPETVVEEDFVGDEGVSGQSRKKPIEVRLAKFEQQLNSIRLAAWTAAVVLVIVAVAIVL